MNPICNDRRVAILSGGMWHIRRQIAAVLGADPVRYRWPIARPAFDAVAGWGMKDTSDRARALAAATGKPYLALEDGFLRSVRPGSEAPPLSLVADRRGIYYDATRPSDLEALIAAATTVPAEKLVRARAAMAELRRLKLSKYNDGRLASPLEMGLAAGAGSGSTVLVIDQTWNDASIRLGLADETAFGRMLEAALRENQDATIVVKTHPDVLAGLKRGNLAGADGVLTVACDRTRIKIVADSVNPWCLLEQVDRVYTVTSQLGFEALMAGASVVCFGAPFYAGWGLTDDRLPIPRRTARPSLEAVFAAAYFDYATYICPYRQERIEFEAALDRLAFLRDAHHANAKPYVGYRITSWKRGVISPLLDGAGGRPEYAGRAGQAVAKAKRRGAAVAVWASRATPRLERLCHDAGVPLTRIEDGFLRSVGLGAAYTRGASISLDSRGIYFDATRSSDLEHILETMDFSEALLARARHMRSEIVSRGLTKYNVGTPASGGARIPDRPFVLVPGQVSDDASIRCTVSSTVDINDPAGPNLGLLRAARLNNPDGYLVFKPHPDVMAGLRRGWISQREACAYADEVISDMSIVPLLAACHKVETLTSLAGFEALLRGKPVVTHGVPFYSGWGLTTDMTKVPRRTRQRTLDELIAAALLIYPRYIDVGSLLPCPPEVVLDALSRHLSRTGAK